VKKIYTILLLFVILSCNTAAQIPAFITDSLDAYVDRALEQWQIPGAAVLIVKDGKVVTAKGYGVKEIGTNDKVDENTLFLIGSNTKAFTGTALALLEYEKECRLEDKVVQYLPEFKMKDQWITNELNLIDIVSHRIGMETFQGDFMYWTSDLTADEVIDKFGMLTPTYNFRTKYGYTNAGYAVAGKIIEKISGLSWADYLKEKFFIPLKMDRTKALSVDYSSSENIAKAHTLIDGKMSLLPFKSFDNLAPCGSISSSINDMTNWITALLDSGRLNGETIIPYSVIKRTREPQTFARKSRHPFNKTNYSLYGLGWAMEDYEGRELISHTGGVNGFVTSVTLIPEENLGIVVLTNNDQNAFFQMLKWEIADAFLGLPFRDYNGYMYERAKIQIEKRDLAISEWKDSVSMKINPEVDLSNFAGRYEHEVYGYAELIQKDDYLELRLQHHSDITGKLEYIGSGRFLCTYSDPVYGKRVFPFKIENKSVKSFELFVDDFIEFLSYEFVKKK
jgi:CubicO group peptidase (beta-lactamase class C family)